MTRAEEALAGIGFAPDGECVCCYAEREQARARAFHAEQAGRMRPHIIRRPDGTLGWRKGA